MVSSLILRDQEIQGTAISYDANESDEAVHLRHQTVGECRQSRAGVVEDSHKVQEAPEPNPDTPGNGKLE